jgi:hypothetical protein
MNPISACGQEKNRFGSVYGRTIRILHSLLKKELLLDIDVLIFEDKINLME